MGFGRLFSGNNSNSKKIVLKKSNATKLKDNVSPKKDSDDFDFEIVTKEERLKERSSAYDFLVTSA